MGKVMQSLRNDLSSDGSKDKKEEEILTRLSGEFRSFLSAFTGMPCQAMTAGEFITLLPLITFGESALAYPTVISGPFLCGIFRHCDTLRFSGTGIPRGELFGILDEIQRFIETLGQIEKKDNSFWKIRSDRIASRKATGDAA
jgi:hypothetical protein